jgi:hypothetical protein
VAEWWEEREETLGAIEQAIRESRNKAKTKFEKSTSKKHSKKTTKAKRSSKSSGKQGPRKTREHSVAAVQVNFQRHDHARRACPAGPTENVGFSLLKYRVSKPICRVTRQRQPMQ